MLFCFKTPIGYLSLQSNNGKITTIKFSETDLNQNKTNSEILKCKEELLEYIAGIRKNFDCKLELSGTEFQKKVWKELMKIPYGKTVSYKYIAEQIGQKTAYRAVANAIGKNPISIIIPCHRVIGSNGKLVGFRYGLEKKLELLKIERYIK